MADGDTDPGDDSAGGECSSLSSSYDDVEQFITDAADHIEAAETVLKEVQATIPDVTLQGVSDADWNITAHEFPFGFVESPNLRDPSDTTGYSTTAPTFGNKTVTGVSTDIPSKKDGRSIASPSVGENTPELTLDDSLTTELSFESPTTPTFTFPNYKSFSVSVPDIKSISTDSISSSITIPDIEPTTLVSSTPGSYTASTSSGPTVNSSVNVTIPASPDLTYPDLPSLSSIDTITIPDYSPPTFNSSLEVKDDLTISLSDFVWNNDFTVNLGYLDSVLSARDSRPVGVSNSTWNSIWSKGVDRENIATQRLIDEATIDMSSRGFSLPQGIYLARIDKAKQEAMAKTVTNSRELTIEYEKEQVEIFKHYNELAVKHEELEFKMRDAIANRSLEVAKIAHNATIELFNVQAKIYNAKVDRFKAYVDKYKAEIQASITEFDAYKTLVEIEKAKADVNRSQADAYKSTVDGVSARIQAYKVEVEAAVEEARINIENERLNLENYKVGIERDRVEIERVAQLDIGALKLGIDQDKVKVEAFTAASDRYAKEANVAIKNKDIEVEQAKLNIQTYNSEIEAYKAELEKDKLTLEGNKISVDQYRALNESFSNNINKYKVDVDAQRLKVDKYNTDIKKESLKIDKYKADISEMLAEIENYKAEIDNERLKIEQDRTEVEFRKAEIDKYRAEIAAYSADIDREYKYDTVKLEADKLLLAESNFNLDKEKALSQLDVEGTKISLEALKHRYNIAIEQAKFDRDKSKSSAEYANNRSNAISQLYTGLASATISAANISYGYSAQESVSCTTTYTG